MGDRRKFLCVVLALSVVAGACGDDDSSGDETTTTSSSSTSTAVPCPIAGGTATAGSGDASSIVVAASTEGDYDAGPNSGQPWCDIGLLQISKVSDVAGLIEESGCPDDPEDRVFANCNYVAVAAMNVKPDDVAFAAGTDNEPDLSFDIVANPTPCTTVADFCWFFFYQLVQGDWRDVAQAILKQGDTLATGNVDHFSTFLLVEAPPPIPVAPGQVLERLTVVSPFAEDETGAIIVSLRFPFDYLLEGDIERQLSDGDQRIFRFDFVGDREVGGVESTDCAALSERDDQLTCLFPPDTELTLEIAGDGVGLISGNEAFLAATVAIH